MDIESKKYMNNEGYWYIRDKGRNIRVCRLVACAILGRPLLRNEQAHHADGCRSNDSPENIIVCNSGSDHVQLHLLLRSKKESGHYSWRKCCYCKQYDDPKNMVKKITKSHHLGEYFHKLCKKQYMKTHKKTNPEHIRTYMRIYMKTYMRGYYEKNKEALKATARKRYRENRETIL